MFGFNFIPKNWDVDENQKYIFFKIAVLLPKFGFFLSIFLLNLFMTLARRLPDTCHRLARTLLTWHQKWGQNIDIYTSGLPARLWKALSKMAEIWECLLMKLTADQYFLYYLRASDVQSLSYSSFFVSIRQPSWFWTDNAKFKRKYYEQAVQMYLCQWDRNTRELPICIYLICDLVLQGVSKKTESIFCVKLFLNYWSL